MMREILFRGKMDNGEWVYGSFCMDALEQFNGLCGVDGFIRLYDKTKGKMQTHEVDRETVGQYTGLKDKNGKRIFEGDILGSRYDDLHPVDVTIEVVKWFRNGWYIQQGENLPDALAEDGVLPYSEVIGNITDNPELLADAGMGKQNGIFWQTN